MNNRTIKFIKDFSYTVASNLVSLIVSTLIVLVIPRLIGVEEYGYWQLYIFYSSYVGFLHFGWSDGIYLRYGGKEYKDLDKGIFFSQFYMMLILQIIIALIIFYTPMFFIENYSKVFIFQMVSINLLIVNVLSLLLLVLQATNRIKEYAQITIISRLIYAFLIIFLLIFNFKEYQLMIIADLIGKLLSLFLALYWCRDIVFCRICKFKLNLKETKNNISVGIKLMFSNIASMLIIGVVRLGIEYSWNVKTFGKVSLILSISNFMMLFINAIGIIMFPILRRTDEKRLANIYKIMRDFLMIVLLGSLILYYPLKVLLNSWLVKYADSFIYMSLIFPICVFEGKMSLLINTYLKTLRKEKIMLKINIIVLMLSVLFTSITTIQLRNLDLAIVSIPILLALRCIIAELTLEKILVISLRRDILLELIITLIFILTAWFMSASISVLIYILIYIMYILLKKNDIVKLYKNIRLLISV